MPQVAQYQDNGDGRDWPGYGRTFGEQHYSPLGEINQSTISRLGLAWSMDLGPENSVTQPIAVEGVLFFATGYSIIHAVDAASGRLLWRYDPQVAENAGLNLRFGWGSRGIAWWDGKVYTGTQDGRLIAIDASTGKPVWSVQTFDKEAAAYITGAPRVFAGTVVIGHSSDTGKDRGYVTAYDADSGQQRWRFYTVPGDLAKRFESQLMERAAQTWTGEWWKFGGGGEVWNAMAYDPETDMLYIGTGNGYPMNRRVRSADQGDNLFVASILALDGKTGAYKWHYQLNPGDTWDYDATADIELAQLTIGGAKRKVLIQAPKNGFFYVIDRLTGRLISAEPYAKVTWAGRIDLKTGRPVETPGARYPNGTTTDLWPSSFGAHGWLPMAYSPKTHLAYVPVMEMGQTLNDRGIDLTHWQPPTDRVIDPGFGGSLSPDSTQRGALLAWNPVTQSPVWSAPYPTLAVGGVLATGGDLVFQGTAEGTFRAYAADTGTALWSFPAQAPLIAPPLSYQVNGRQYVTVLTGLGTDVGRWAVRMGKDAIDPRSGIDPRSQARRVLTFALNSEARLPSTTSSDPPAVEDPTFKPDASAAAAGEQVYGRHCAVCHGVSVVGIIHAPDLRRSAITLSELVFRTVVRDGGLVSRGMPAFGELTAQQLEALCPYIRIEAQKLRESDSMSPAARGLH